MESQDVDRTGSRRHDLVYVYIVMFSLQVKCQMALNML